MALTKADATIIAKGTSNAAFTQLTGCSATRSGTTATLTKTSHGRSAGDKVLVQGFSLTEFNGIFSIATVPDANTFTYTISADPGANPSGTPGTVDLVTLGTALDLTGSYDCLVFGGVQNGTTGPSPVAQIWVGESLTSSEADYVWRPLLSGDSAANAWVPFSWSPSQSAQFVNVACARNATAAVDCFALATHITAF